MGLGTLFHRQFRPAFRGHRRPLLIAVALLSSLTSDSSARSARPGLENTPRHTISHFSQDLPRLVRADHPAILPVAEAIRAVTLDPLEQIAMVHDITHRLVEYDEDLRVYGRDEYHATLDEMIARRREAGWLYLRDDCDGRAVFAAHLLASLQIPWELRASSLKAHAWVTATVAGRRYDLLDLTPDNPSAQRLAFRIFGRALMRASNPPPAFDWRRRWAIACGKNVGIGIRLGLLSPESSSEMQRYHYSIDWAKAMPNLHTAALETRSGDQLLAGFPVGEMLRPGNALAQVDSPWNVSGRLGSGPLGQSHASASLGESGTGR